MRFEVTFKNVRATDALRERAQSKFEKGAGKHLKEPIEAHVVVHVEKHRHCAELTVKSAGDTLKARHETDDMYATIDGLMHKIERVARRAKERTLDRVQTGGEPDDGFTPTDEVEIQPAGVEVEQPESPEPSEKEQVEA